MKEYRTKNRYFCAVLYEEDENFKNYVNKIENLYQEVTYIKHDKDITEDGELKKEHYHFLFKVGENARSIKTIAKEIGIAENYLQGCNKKAMLQYLIHMNNPEKTQYNLEEVKGELREELKEIIENKRSEEEKLEPIIYYIHNRHINNLYKLMNYGIQAKETNLIRKYQYILTKLIEEENKNEILQSRSRRNERENKDRDTTKDIKNIGDNR